MNTLAEADALLERCIRLQIDVDRMPLESALSGIKTVARFVDDSLGEILERAAKDILYELSKKGRNSVKAEAP